jgi:hypothetical protein
VFKVKISMSNVKFPATVAIQPASETRHAPSINPKPLDEAPPRLRWHFASLEPRLEPQLTYYSRPGTTGDSVDFRSKRRACVCLLPRRLPSGFCFTPTLPYKWSRTTFSRSLIDFGGEYDSLSLSS